MEPLAGAVPPRLSDLVRISDTLTWSSDHRESFLRAVRIVRGAVGAWVSPAYLLDDSATVLRLVADDADRAAIGPGFESMPASEHIRAPWLNRGEWPVSASGHLDHEAWRSLPDDFKAWFGTSGIVVSLHADGRHLGAILLCFDRDFVPTEATRGFLAVAGRIIGGAVYRWQVAARERELGALEERRRLSAELHDDLSQQVAGLGLRVASMKLDLEQADVASMQVVLGQVDAMVGELRARLRHLMLGLRADAALAEGMFLDQVRHHVEQFELHWGLPTQLVCARPDLAERVPIEVGAQLVRVLQEALSNCYLHARASQVRVCVEATSTKVSLIVEDDGEGFDPASILDTRLGVRIMRERLEQIGGTLTIRAADERGTRVTAEAPVRSLAPIPVAADDFA